MRTIREITLRNMLSFGPDTPPLELRDLNVLIGPNASGKSNLLAGISLFRATPGRFAAVIRRTGGITEWLWKGGEDSAATAEAVVQIGPRTHLRHQIEFTAESQRFELTDERIEAASSGTQRGSRVKPRVYYDYRRGSPVIFRDGRRFRIGSGTFHHRRSVLSQRADPDRYPKLAALVEAYESIQVYTDWAFGPHSKLRRPEPADQPNRYPQPSPQGWNLGLVLNRLRRDPQAKKAVLKRLGELYAGIDDYDVSIESGTVQLFLTEEPGYRIPATRLSDGTLRYLFLLAVLCDPKPPRLVCIEEPELGLHPDVIPTIGELLREASKRTQLIVTTHSDILVDALSDTPESVVVCEKHDGRTVMQRLDARKLRRWLEKYRLGELWTSGEIGGVRW